MLTILEGSENKFLENVFNMNYLYWCDAPVLQGKRRSVQFLQIHLHIHLQIRLHIQIG